jgi:hypothetical protein
VDADRQARLTQDREIDDVVAHIRDLVVFKPRLSFDFFINSRFVINALVTQLYG